MLKICSAQINPTIGDFSHNIQLMVRAARKAAEDSAHLVVYPELSLTGYYPGDLLEEDQFTVRMTQALEDLKQETRQLPELYWVVGAPTQAKGPGKALHNSLLVIKNGEVVLEYSKQLLPTYNIFDERRHFEPGPDVTRVLRIGAHSIGFIICEDGWNADGADYRANPLARLADASPDLVVSINASPSNIGKREQRHRLFKEASEKFNLPILYVNQFGGQDQLVFDGASFAVSPKQGVCFEAARFEEDLTTLVFDPNEAEFTQLNRMDFPKVREEGLPTAEFYRKQIVLGLKDYARRTGFTKAVIGSSGGIDSAVTMALAVEALGAENVVGITMPSRYSSEGSVSDSEVLCQNLGIKLLEHPIKSAVSAYEAGFKEATGDELKGLALENLQARIRGTILMEYSNSYGHLLLTTGNKSEISVGYCTLYGDTNGGLGLIGDLYKTEVFELARHINDAAGREIVPVAIIEKAPSAELAPGQKDTDSLPPYEVLDEILKVLIEGHRLSAAEKSAAQRKMRELCETSEGTALVERVKKMIARNEYKRRQSPPIIRVRGRAFGSGRQVPIAAKHF